LTSSLCIALAVILQNVACCGTGPY
jgi:hypothetical protein